MLVPPWLEKLLNTSFFNVCRTHADAARSECNMYCLDCNVDAFCFYCRSSKHKDHQVIQIQKVLDISGVQTYVINSARVLFLNERPQPKGGKAVSHVCEICGRSLLDTFRFCSLGSCRNKGNGDASFTLDAKNEVRGEGVSSTRMNISSSSREEEELREGSQQDIYPPTPPHLLLLQEEEKASLKGHLLGPKFYY
ncbi:hypothetical protein DH2020_026111 [Rehmannia glutinosa]|uniref:B box-type domain-containing protein n=1 Tax=Rehmannia glutinosa TaxID=99300 RepID=A0ABR0VXU8_REHGL